MCPLLFNNLVLNYLRTGSVPAFDKNYMYQELLEEADFFGLMGLKNIVEAKIAEMLAAANEKDQRAREMAQQHAQQVRQQQQQQHIQLLSSNNEPTTPRTILRNISGINVTNEVNIGPMANSNIPAPAGCESLNGTVLTAQNSAAMHSSATTPCGGTVAPTASLSPSLNFTLEEEF